MRGLRRLVFAAAALCALAGPSRAATPLLMYLMTSPSSGSVSSIADTSTGTAINLTATSVTGTSIASGVGATFVSASSGAVSGSLASTKVATALAGATKVSFEVVVDTTNETGFNDIIGLQATSFDDWCSVFTGSSGAQRVAIACAGGIVYYTVVPGLHRLTAVVDTTQALNTSRFTLYDNGSAAAVDSGVAPSWPAQNTAIDAGFTNYANNRVSMGCLISAGVQALTGSVYLAIVYAAALTSTDAAAHNTALASNNDADPNGAASPASDAFLFATARGWAPPPPVASVPVGPWRPEVVEAPDPVPLALWRLPYCQVDEARL